MSASSPALPAALIGNRRFDLAAIALGAVPATLIVYLALENGGYGIVERSEAGIAVWWLVLVGCAVGMFPVRPLPRSAIVLVALLGAFATWTTLSLGWTESDERTAIEAGRVVAYLGIFTLALIVQRGERWRAVFAGVVAGIGVVLVLALLSKLQPNWFPDQVAHEYLPGAQLERRLAYPLNYSTGVAALAAIAIPLLLALAASARRIALQSAAAALLAVAAVVLWITASSLLVPLALIAIVSYLLLATDRLATLATTLVALAGAAIAIAAFEQREALDAGLGSATALAEGDEMSAIVLVVCAGVGSMQAGIGLLARHGRSPAWLDRSRRLAPAAAVAALAALVAVALATPLREEIEAGWDDFRGPSEIDEASASRLQEILDPSSQGRYAFWEAAVDAGRSEPLTGTGAGSFEFWWTRENRSGEFVRDAHSLFAETFAELGAVGLILIVSFVVGVIAVGVARARGAPPGARAALAGATSAAIVFAAAAAVDWAWELAVLPAIFMVLAAVIVFAGRDDGLEAGAEPRTPDPAPRLAIVVVAIVAIVAIALPLAAQTAIDESRAAANRGDAAALEHADEAAAIAPYAATPELQRALVLERRGELGAAAAAARAAAGNEPTNWRTWLVVSRLESRRGDAAAAVEAYRRARALNPLSPVLAR